MDVDVTRQLSLIKGKHRFVFRYRAGCEEELVDALASMANDPVCDFDWFDAAVLSYQMGRRIETEVDQLRTKR